MEHENSELNDENERKLRYYQKFMIQKSEEERRIQLISILEFKVNELDKRVEYLEDIVDKLWNKSEEQYPPSSHDKSEPTDENTQLQF